MRFQGKYLVGFLVLLVVLSTIPQNTKLTAVTPIANLKIKVYENGRGALDDYAYMIAEQLEEIGISCEVEVVPYSIDVESLLIGSYFDLAVVDIDFPLNDPDPSAYLYSKSYFDYHMINTEMPYGNLSDTILEEALASSNFAERRETYLEWSNMVMDKIIPIYPLFNPREGSISWPNLWGYELNLGLSESLPHMYFEDLHTNQISIGELNLAYDSMYRQDEMYSLISDNLIYYYDYYYPDWFPIGGLIENWEKHNETHYTFYVRDNVFWNPSYNISERNEYSEPLQNISESSLMRGLKNDEFSNGSNQQLSAKDVVFTLLYHSSELIGVNEFEYKWIKKLELNESNNLAFDLFIDADPETSEQEPYIPLWSKLSITCMPEFFLNSTDTTISYTSGGIPVSGYYNGITSTEPWYWYFKSRFGCGKYMLDYSLKDNISVLKSSPYWHGHAYLTDSEVNLNISTVNFKYIQNQETRLTEYYNGGIDIYSYDDFIPYIPFEPIHFYQQRLSPRTTCLLFNLARPFIGGADNYVYLDEPDKQEYTKGMAVRKAICYAIDLDAINSEIHDGQHRIARALVHDYHMGSLVEDVFYYNHDLDAAYYWLGIDPPTTPTSPLTTITYSMNWLLVLVLSTIVFRTIRIWRKTQDEI